MLHGRSEPPFALRSGAAGQVGLPVAARRGTQKVRRGLPSVDRGAYHLPPIGPSSALAPSAAAPRRASGTVSPDLPLTVSAASPARPLVSSRALVGPVQMWPAITSTRQRRRQDTLESKAPLSLQLEGFIRREHQQYIREHPSCSRTDTLFIFREALATFVNHFAEYRGVLYLIRDEYDAALGEMTDKAKQMQVEYLESQSDRGLHAMELIQLKESMNATISNQQAQLGVLQGLVHALRDQLTAAEHANSALTLEMEQKKKTYVEAQQQVKLLSRAMIEETARTAAERERAQKLEKASQLQESRIKVLQGNVAELEECLREQAYAQVEVTNPRGSAGSQLGMARHRSSAQSGSGDVLAVEAEAAASTTSASRQYVAQLLTRIDALEMRLRQLQGDDGAAAAAVKRVSTNGAHSAATTATDASRPAAAATAAAATSGVDAIFPVVRQWLRMEGIGEAEVEATDVIVPAGHCPTEDSGFLAATLPVRHRHLSLDVVLRMVRAMWAARDRPTTEKTRLRQFFAEWLSMQAADPAESKALGLNILDTCQHNLHHPECRTLLLVLRGYLPEELVHVCRRRLAQLQHPAQVSPTTLLDKMPFDDFFAHVRAVCPEKSIANMLQLRFTVYHRFTDANLQVTLPELFHDDSYFVRLFRQQWLQEVESFTLRVVEGVREVVDEKHNSVSLVKVMSVMRGLDASLGDEEVHKWLSVCCQKPVIDVAMADDSTSTHADALLARLRSVVLLKRRSPEDALEE